MLTELAAVDEGSITCGARPQASEENSLGLWRVSGHNTQLVQGLTEQCDDLGCQCVSTHSRTRACARGATVKDPHCEISRISQDPAQRDVGGPRQGLVSIFARTGLCSTWSNRQGMECGVGACHTAASVTRRPSRWSRVGLSIPRPLAWWSCMCGGRVHFAVLEFISRCAGKLCKVVSQRVNDLLLTQGLCPFRRVRGLLLPVLCECGGLCVLECTNRPGCSRVANILGFEFRPLLSNSPPTMCEFNMVGGCQWACTEGYSGPALVGHGQGLRSRTISGCCARGSEQSCAGHSLSLTSRAHRKHIGPCTMCGSSVV